ncbi:MAG: FtsQ-type POTRA domain-containing protein [Lentisphaerae bacterium]|nr:FtsQ-type POTRA domain-containing protein [Lentisphaerota bacterium]
MAVKKTTAKNSDAGEAVGGRVIFRRLLFGISIFSCIALLGAGVWLICRLPDVLMYQNQRFEFKHPVIQSAGYWGRPGKQQELLDRIGLNGKINIFGIDVGDVRKKVLNIDNIRDAEVQIVLPDTLIFRLEERIPLAYVGGDMVIDEDGERFGRTESVALDRELPFIVGYREDRSDKISEALKLIVTANRNCQALKIKKILVSNYDYLDVFLVYRGRDLRVKFPLNKDYADLFNKLQSAVLHSYLNRENPSGFDLRYRDYAIPEY